MKILLRNCKVVFPDIVRACEIVVEGKYITQIIHSNKCISGYDKVIDAQGFFLVPGLIDLHIHGCMGFDVMDNSLVSIKEICNYMMRNGVLGFFPTTLSSNMCELISFLKLMDDVDLSKSEFMNIIGVHLEGPYLATQAAGAQDQRYIHLPKVNEVMKIVEMTDKIKRWSVAPELPGIETVVDVCKEKNILLAIAHTDADFGEVGKARKAGFSHVTHLYSGMKSIHYEKGLRKAGAVEAALYYDDLTVEVIGDGIHIPYDLLQLIYKVKGADKIAIVSDAMRATGQNGITESILGSKVYGQKVYINSGVAKSHISNTLAGSITPLSVMIKQIYKNTDIPLIDIIKMVTKVPAVISGLHDRGIIRKGFIADLLLLDENLEIKMVMKNGRIMR